MVGNTTTTIETVPETSLTECNTETFPQNGRILLEEGTNIIKAEVGQDSLTRVTSDKPEALAHVKDTIDAIITEIFPFNQAIEGERGTEAAGTTVATVHETPLIGRELDDHALLKETASASPEIVQDILIQSNKHETSPRKIDALITENISRKQQEQPALDISQIRPKTNSERYVELIIQNREKECETVIDESLRLKYLHSNKTKWNFVFNTWPVSRDRNSYSYLLLRALSNDPRGLAKFTGSGQGHILWGESLADFFRMVNLVGETIGDQVHTSSILYNWARGRGINILPFAKRLMSLAEREDRPRVMPVYNIEQLIRNSEAWIREQEVVSWTRPGRPDEKAEGKERDPWEVPESWPPESVFSPSAYPSPWPFEPFKKQWWHPQEKFGTFIHTPKLQQYIPQHLLPDTLVVHDPYKILDACDSYSWLGKTPWIEKDDIVRIYKLKHQKIKQPREIQDVKEYEEELARVKSVREAFLADPHSHTEMPDGMIYRPGPSDELKLGPCKPPVYAVIPPKPLQPAAKIAHLYMSPVARLGSGNHSFVYKAEFEVPRSFLVSEEICKDCVTNDVKRILEEEDGPNGESRDARWDELSGKYTVKVRGKPARNVMLGDEEHKCKPDRRKVEVVYEGPYRAIQTTVGYQNLERAPYCEHLRKDRIHPLTTKVQVAAKVSIEDDDHLDSEASYYRSFPKDFFEHYNGFNVVNPLTTPTPVGALVPQFYGYYILDKDDAQNKEFVDEYLSPILLVEDCGVSINPEELSKDDTHECASLFHRMHAANYYHGSPYRRNIVRQPGPLTEHPLVRQSNVAGTSRVGSKWSYRLIDFGRTRHKKKTDSGDYAETMDWENSKMKRWLRDGYLG